MSKKIVLVTGANRGIGKAIVKGLSHDKDYTVLLGCRNLELGQEALNELDSNVELVQLDLSSRKILKEQANAIIEKYGHVDILVNNAGVLHDDNVLNISDENFDETLRINLVAIYDLIKIFLPKMVERDFGRIVNIASGWGCFNEGVSGPFSYAISKAALNALTLNLSHSLPPTIKINSMCPGWVRTRMGGEEAERTPEEGAETALFLARLAGDGPTGRFFRDKEEIPW